MSIDEQLDPAAADEIVAKEPPVEGDFLHRVLHEDRDEPPASPLAPTSGRIARGARATGRGLLGFLLFLLGLAAGGGAGFGYGVGLVEGENRVDLLPPYADWPALWWVLLGSVPVVLVLASWRRIRPVCFGYLVALPWQLVVALVYAYVTFGTWGYAPQP
ncbi:hypothetical protein [Nocardioides sp.]|uniref:hypothetical protein n=1 Tax=Nocardioides sp. TaxID=35761 RepID=UPI002D0769C9|nr:hypothetical protein [Nocardioides sp.]HSX68203.1 hypothetical protein [Nocardioides sp.]